MNRARWTHGKDLSLENVRAPFEAAKSAIERALEEEKRKLYRMSGLRDKLRGR